MHLKSLELSGFKSFAKKSVLDFTSPITGIVGPNGSGKSNIAEAFQFVLGEQSIKSLRGKRGEDLIWNGGGESGRANRAWIKLRFDNTAKIFQSMDFDEVSIERIVHRDNVNEYLVNGSQVRLKDMVELLAGAHIGATGHHIISQGEADRILTASIRERREMIEDALGLKIYQWKKLESVKKLDKTSENMKQVESLRREIAPHVKFLKKQVEKVEKAEEMKRELVFLYKEYFAYENHHVKTEKERLSRLLFGQKKELSELNFSLEKAKSTLTASKNKDRKSDSIIILERKLNAIRADKDSISRECGRIEGEINANKRVLDKEGSRIKNEESKTVPLKDVEEVVNRVESLSVISDAKKLFSEIIGTLRDFIAKHRFLTVSPFISQTKDEINGLYKEKQALEVKRDSVVEEESELNREYNELKQLIEKEKDTNREAEKDVFRIIARQNEVRGIITAFNEQLKIIFGDEEALKRELGEAAVVAGREAIEYAAIEIEDKATKNENAERLKKIEKIKIRLEDAGDSGGAEVVKEFKETEERDAFLARELEDLEKAKNELIALIAELDQRIDLEFRSGIMKINAEFQKFFTLQFGGGKAELGIVKEPKRKKGNDLDELNAVLNGAEDFENRREIEEEGPEGLEVNISLPRKKIKSLIMLSGGERALTSIALLFAISQVNPPPFIVLDETDAALDEANSKKYGDMIESLSRSSQLILITHNRETMSRAGALYGITMGSDGASRLISIAFEEAVKVAK